MDEFDKDRKIEQLKAQLKSEQSFNSAIKQGAVMLCVGLTDLLKQIKEDEKTSAALKGVRMQLESLSESISSHRSGE